MLPLPRVSKQNQEAGNGQEELVRICSRRCAGKRAESAEVVRNRAALEALILTEVRALRKGTTVCPGELSHRVLPGVDQPLTVLRPLIYELAAAGKLRLRQKGAVVLWEKVRGPFRVGG
jgi:hypothetical protein